MNKTWKVILAFAVVFAAGAVSGRVFTLHCEKIAEPPPARPQTFGAQLMMRWLRSNALNLTQEQRNKIRPLVADTAEDLRRLHREDAHTAELIIERMQDEIAATLNPDQRNTFNDMIQRQREKMNRFMQEQQRRALLQEDRAGP